MADYVLQEEVQTLSFHYDWKFSFLRPDFSYGNESIAVKSFAEDKKYCSIGLAVLVFLWRFKFITKEQIIRLADIHNWLEGFDIDEFLAQYVAMGFLNGFSLSQYPMDSVPEDAFLIYCLDHQARHILGHFYHSDSKAVWRGSDAQKIAGKASVHSLDTTWNAEKVSKYLTTNEFYLALLKAYGNRVLSFEPAVNFDIQSRDFRMSGVLCVQGETQPKTFLVETVRSYDVPVYWKKKSGTQINPFLTRRYWTKYFHTVPPFIFLVENLQDGAEIAGTFAHDNPGFAFYLLTDPDVSAGIGQAPLYLYQDGGLVQASHNPIM